MKRMLVCGAALVAVASLAPLASAQIPGAGRMIHFGIGGGVSVPVSDASDAFKSGGHLKGWVSFKPPALPFGIRGALGYERMDLKNIATTFVGTPVQGTGTVISGLGDVTLGFPVGPIKPYILAGLGAFNLKADDGTGYTTSKTQFGINGGVGVELHLGQIAAFVEGRMENIYTDQGLSAALGSQEKFKTQIIPVTFGISY
jgi:opacity protein-like surface antigen